MEHKLCRKCREILEKMDVEKYYLMKGNGEYAELRYACSPEIQYIILQIYPDGIKRVGGLDKTEFPIDSAGRILFKGE